MNQEDIILLGEFLNELSDTWQKDEKYGILIKKAILISKQAKASKDYQEEMDKLNNELSSLGKDGEDGKNEES